MLNLRSIDLSEYAPNLRGSGVHGALMSLEPRFVGETLADVLCIPQSKTLLRRHLVAQFNRLVGAPCEQLKRMVELSGEWIGKNIGYIPKLIIMQTPGSRTSSCVNLLLLSLLIIANVNRGLILIYEFSSLIVKQFFSQFNSSVDHDMRLTFP